MGRGDLTNGQRPRLEPLLPRGIKPGPASGVAATAVDRRHTVADPHRRPWRDVPERYGPWDQVYDLFRRWQRRGTWAGILARLHAEGDAKGLLTWEVNVGSTVCRAHQHAAGAVKRETSRRSPRRCLHRAGCPRPRTVPRRPDQQDPPRRRARAEALAGGDHRRATGRLSVVRAGPGSDSSASPRARQATQTPRACAGRQGIRLSQQPLLPAQTRNQGHDPRARRAGPQPAGAWFTRWAAAEVRPGRLQAAARRRVRDQPPGRHRAVATRYGKLAVRYEATVLVAAISE
ncbi:transposase [Streptomyces goshikiensis]|uniref:transposase n=1 Tax=Streptomyces goshikiensis TaxID=1942 RepID=UPI00367CF9F5